MQKKELNWVKLTPKNKNSYFKKLEANRRQYVEAGLELGYKVELLSYFQAIRFSQKGKNAYLVVGALPINNISAYRVGNNKYITYSLWNDYNVYCPKFKLVTKKELSKSKDYKKGLKFPIVVKPVKGVQGKDVITNINTKKELQKYIKKILNKEKEVLIEEYHPELKEYRITIFKGKIIAVAYKKPAYIIGNGKNSINKLIQKKNRERKRYMNYNLKPIKLDKDLKKKLKDQKLTLGSIPEKGEHIQLKNLGNLSIGGEMVKVKKIHPSVSKMALKAVKLLDLDYCGLDLLAKDISKPLKKGRDIFIEGNEIPGMNLHFDWDTKEMSQIALKIMKHIYD